MSQLGSHQDNLPCSLLYNQLRSLLHGHQDNLQQVQVASRQRSRLANRQGNLQISPRDRPLDSHRCSRQQNLHLNHLLNRQLFLPRILLVSLLASRLVNQVDNHL